MKILCFILVSAISQSYGAEIHRQKRTLPVQNVNEALANLTQGISQLASATSDGAPGLPSLPQPVLQQILPFLSQFQNVTSLIANIQAFLNRPQGNPLTEIDRSRMLGPISTLPFQEFNKTAISLWENIAEVFQQLPGQDSSDSSEVKSATRVNNGTILADLNFFTWPQIFDMVGRRKK